MDKDQDMGQVAAQADRDQATYRAWVDGARQVDLADQYGVTQQAISQAVGRVLDAMPPADKDAEIRRTLDLIDDLVQVYAPKARAGNPAAAREVRGLLALRGRYLGVDRREVHVEHGGQVEHYHHPAPPVAELLERWRAEGFIRAALHAQAVRLDQDQNLGGVR
jgi:hypothetical protein